MAFTRMSLDERHFRNVSKFGNKEANWKEWRSHFRGSQRNGERPRRCYGSIGSEGHSGDGAGSFLLGASIEAVNRKLLNRLVSLTMEAGFQLVESSNGNGLEASTLFSRRYNPDTPAQMLRPRPTCCACTLAHHTTPSP